MQKVSDANQLCWDWCRYLRDTAQEEEAELPQKFKSLNEALDLDERKFDPLIQEEEEEYNYVSANK